MRCKAESGKRKAVRQWRAFDVLQVVRLTERHQKRPEDADLRKALKDVAAEGRRFGQRRIHIGSLPMNDERLLIEIPNRHRELNLFRSGKAVR